MSFIEAISSCMSKFGSFEGRAPRSEYWYFVLFQFLSLGAALILGSVLGEVGLIVLVFVAILALFVPAIAVTVRRLHDTNRSGWWYWIGIIPYIGPLILLFMCVMPGTEGENDYGYPLEAGGY